MMMGHLVHVGRYGDDETSPLQKNPLHKGKSWMLRIWLGMFAHKPAHKR